jgi:hypothetical protein
VSVTRPLIRPLAALAAFLSMGFGSAGAWAAVEISFYSRELGGNNFPHAFVTLKGTRDRDGLVVDQALGFTAKAVTPAILLGSVGGKVAVEPPGYIAKSDRQFGVVLSDAQFDSVMEAVDRWRHKAQPSYNLNRANCVHFVGEVARAAGLSVDLAGKLMKKPRSFLLAVKKGNEFRLAGDSGAVPRGDAAAR